MTVEGGGMMTGLKTESARRDWASVGGKRAVTKGPLPVEQAAARSFESLPGTSCRRRRPSRRWQSWRR